MKKSKKYLCPSKPELTLSRYMKDLNDGVFRGKYLFGIQPNSVEKYLMKDFFLEPNALYVGAMGTGKSVAACFSLVTWMLSNSDQTLLFIVNADKGASDYRSLFKYQDTNQVFPVLSSEVGIHRVIDLIYDEAIARRELLNSVKADSVCAYEKITGKKLTRIITTFEEFHSIIYSNMNFEENFKKTNTTANKFFTLMKIGRSLGIWFIASDQKGTHLDLPPEIEVNFSQKLIFSDSRAECVSVIIPEIPIEVQEQLLCQHIKGLSSEFAHLTPGIITDSLSLRSGSL